MFNLYLDPYQDHKQLKDVENLLASIEKIEDSYLKNLFTDNLIMGLVIELVNVQELSSQLWGLNDDHYKNYDQLLKEIKELKEALELAKV